MGKKRAKPSAQPASKPTSATTGVSLEANVVTAKRSHAAVRCVWFSGSLVAWLARLAVLFVIFYVSCVLRLKAVFTYGKIIHEFDPWFNFRATEHLVGLQQRSNTWSINEFYNWYDEKSWSPLGRPVGTTIYPGMQITASVIYWGLQAIKDYYPGQWVVATAAPMLAFLKSYGIDMVVPATLDISLNDVCVLMPVGFSVLTGAFTFLLAYEVSASGNVGVVAAAIMAIVPAHSMRSVGGGFDNESVAMAAICSTFFFWVRSLRTSKSWPFGIVAGLAYINMAAAWGGYVFVINMIGVHVAVLCVLGRYTSHLHKAYSLFFVIGTAGALTIPVVGWAPLKSTEQMGPLLVFVGLQLLEMMRLFAHRMGLSPRQFQMFLYALSGGVLAAAYAVFQNRTALWKQFESLVDQGIVWDIGTRVKGLFVEHTKTGNPLVDSVAEHQAVPPTAFFQYLHHVAYAAPVGFVLVAVALVLPFILDGLKRLLCSAEDGIDDIVRARQLADRRTEAKVFLLIYCAISFYFAGTMIRLVLLLAPAASCAAAYALAMPVNEGCKAVVTAVLPAFLMPTQTPAKPCKWRLVGLTWRLVKLLVGTLAVVSILSICFLKVPMRKSMYQVPIGSRTIEFPKPSLLAHKYASMFRSNKGVWRLKWAKPGPGKQFWDHCDSLAESFSEPQVITRGRRQDGSTVIIDDFREGYWWLRDNTPEDARVMAWWDYGYQITGIGNRTTIADGNTWNHEHIALLGRCLVSSEKKGWNIARHLADYVLVWTTRYAGRYGDDLAKSPHMARIAGSVYSDINPADFWMDRAGKASDMMKRSVLYKLHNYRLNPEAGVTSLKYFQEVYTTTNRMMRIYKILRVSKKSKAHPFGSYPPALDKTLARAKDFSEIKRRARLAKKKFD